MRLYGSVLTAGRPAERCRVTTEGARITAVEPASSPSRDDIVVEDGYIAPGLIDLHLHGAVGIDLTAADDPRDAVVHVARALAERGVTAFCPTVVSAPVERYPELLAAYAAMPHDGGAESLGAHLEGPFLEPRKRGIHVAHALRAPALAEVRGWLVAGAPALVTLAPELAGALEVARALTSAGVAVSLGHSLADATAAHAALAAGARHGTHLFNAMPPLHHRAPGLAGALLASDATVELIADGAHLDPLVVALAIRSAGPSRVTLATDGLAAMGAPPGLFALGAEAVISDGAAVRRDDGVLAGTALPLIECVRNVRRWCPWLDDASVIAMATATPASVLGASVAARKGRVAPGYDADLVVLDSHWNVRATYVRGVEVRPASHA